MTEPIARTAESLSPSQSPEELTLFRLGQLLLLLSTAQDLGVSPPSLERLGYYDFFAANPFIVFPEDSPQRRSLRLSGLSSKTLAYASASQRWATRRERLQHDVALLVAHGLAERQAQGRVLGYSASDEGLRLTSELRSLYSQSFRRSAELVLTELSRLSDRKLVSFAESALRQSPLVIDIYGVDIDSEVDSEE